MSLLHNFTSHSKRNHPFISYTNNDLIRLPSSVLAVSFFLNYSMYNISSNSLLIGLIIILLSACSTKKAQQGSTTNEDQSTELTVIRLSDEMDRIISPDAEIEILADGFSWSEGPVWVEELNSLLFTDVPMNIVYQWNETNGKSVFLEPGSFNEANPTSNEPGANGLAIDSSGKLVLCQHGDRRVAQMISPLTNPSPDFTPYVETYLGKKFNSPNDLVFSSDRDLYFTDPPYGLAGRADDPLRELDYCGVYRLTNDGNLSVLDKTLNKPNGIALSPDEQTLYVANSDPENAVWMAYDITEDGVENRRLFFDATELVGEKPGLPDGLKVNQSGIIFATGPGGVWVFKSDGTHLGTIDTGRATANCALGPDEKWLYMTAGAQLMRIPLL